MRKHGPGSRRRQQQTRTQKDAPLIREASVRYRCREELQSGSQCTRDATHEMKGVPLCTQHYNLRKRDGRSR